ncbi:MAG: type I-E CRISPR-associated protein Cas6/Cse3/CasE [Chloroflexota bacterium]
MYLSRLILNPRSRQVQHELADPYEMHRTVCRAFPNANFKENEPSGILFRVDLHPRTGVPTLLVQSQQQPDWLFLHADRKNYLLDEAALPLGVENPAWKEIDLQFRRGQALAFRLRANPTKRLKENAKRIGFFREEDQLAWLKRKVEAAGGTLLSAHVTGKVNLRGKLFIEKDDARRMRFVSAQFEGILQVENPDLLVKNVAAGIGSGKGLGFGLLSIAPARG